MDERRHLWRHCLGELHGNAGGAQLQHADCRKNRDADQRKGRHQALMHGLAPCNAPRAALLEIIEPIGRLPGLKAGQLVQRRGAQRNNPGVVATIDGA